MIRLTCGALASSTAMLSALVITLIEVSLSARICLAISAVVVPESRISVCAIADQLDGGGGDADLLRAMQCLFDVDGQLIALAAGQGAAMSAHHGAHVFECSQVRADRHGRNAEPLSERGHRSLRLLLDERADVAAALFHREPASAYGAGQ